MSYRILVPRPGIEPTLIEWEAQSLTTGLPGKSYEQFIFTYVTDF